MDELMNRWNTNDKDFVIEKLIKNDLLVNYQYIKLFVDSKWFGYLCIIIFCETKRRRRRRIKRSIFIGEINLRKRKQQVILQVVWSKWETIHFGLVIQREKMTYLNDVLDA